MVTGVLHSFLQGISICLVLEATDYDTVTFQTTCIFTRSRINMLGTSRHIAVRAKEDAEAEKLISDAKLLSETGCFSVVLEKVPSALATRVSSEISVPTIGIGAGNGTDGQILVVDDMLGMTKGFSPRFLRRYADLNTVMTDAIGNYITDVKNSDFPNENESY